LEKFVQPRRRFPLRKKLVGLEILEGRAAEDLPAAAVSSECRSPTLGKAIALAFVDPESSDPGAIVRLADGRAGRVAALPFYDALRRLPRGAPLPG
jgi:glycine cleavage system aminomethyltransferase T